MANGTQVSQAYLAMRNALKVLSDKTVDSQRQIVLLQRAAVAGSLAEAVDNKFGNSQVPGGDSAIASANGTTQLANAADGTNNAALDVVIDAAVKSNELLARIVNGRAALARFSETFRGGLRVSPPPASASPQASVTARVMPGGQPLSGGGGGQSPSYVASVALLFPIEATTLFPLGQEIAGQNPTVTYMIIAIIALFVVALRWIGTQPAPEDGGGPPAYPEILVAVVSFLLWVGALKGYWPEHPDSAAASYGAKIFGFIIIMWVALVPAFVRKPPLAQH